MTGSVALTAHVREVNEPGRSSRLAAVDNAVGPRAEDELYRLARAGGPIRELLAEVALRLVSTQAWSRLGYTRLGDYTRERLGTPARSVRDWACVGARLDELPELRAALASGRLPWSKVRLLARFVETGDEDAWIAFAEQHSVKTLEGELRAVDRGSLEAGAASREVEDGPCWVRISAPMSLAFKWQRTKRQAIRVEGAELLSGEVLERVTAEVLAALPVQLEEVGEDENDENDVTGDVMVLPIQSAASPPVEAVSWSPRVVERDRPPAQPPAFLDRLIEGLADADAFELDTRLRQLIRLEQRLDAQLSRLVRMVMAPEYEWSGERPTQEVLARELLGMSPSKLRALLRIERVGDQCPALREAYRDGVLSWSQAETLAPLLDRDVDGVWREKWVAYAQTVTGLRLKEAVKRAKFVRDVDPEIYQSHQQDPARFAVCTAEDAAETRDRQKCADPMRSTGQVRITFEAANDVAQLFRAVLCTLRRAIERETGQLPSEAEAFEVMLGHALESWGIEEDPWLKRNISKKYRAVLERDGWRCVFPGCTSCKNLHVHHIRFRSAGGGDEPENLTTLCAFHHLRGVHGGTVSVTGSAPDDLEFALGLRPGREPLARYRSGDQVVT